MVLTPAAFDPFMAKGVAFSRFVDKHCKPHQFSRADFGKAAVGADVGHRMRVVARQINVTGLFQAADAGWWAKHGRKFFGSTDITTSPSSWAAAYLDATLRRRAHGPNTQVPPARPSVAQLPF